MVFSTFYFSGTGNTKWAAEQFSNIVTCKGHKAQLFSIDINEKLTDAIIKDIIGNSDFIGFANPIYGADIPPIMKRFISRLNSIYQNEKTIIRSTYIINTCGYVNAFGPIAAKKLFANTCFNLKGYVNIRLCNNVSTPKLKVDRIKKTVINNRKVRGKKELVLLSKRLLRGRKYINGFGPYLIPGIVIRHRMKKAIENNYKSLSVDSQKCKKCMLCINTCPTQSITLYDNQFKFSPSCTACMRCYNFCQTSAILLDGIYADPEEYHRFRGLDA